MAVAGAGAAVFGYEFLSPNVLYEPSPIANAGKPDRYPQGSVTPDPQDRHLHRSRTARASMRCRPSVRTWVASRRGTPELGIIACPCHGSKFTPTGRQDRRSGAAPVCPG